MSKLLEYKGYHATIEFDAEDNIFVGEVIGISDSLNFHGGSVKELQEAFAVCIDDYLEICKLYNKDPDKEYKGSFNVRVGYDLHKKIVLAAAAHGTSINQIVQEALQEYFDPDIRTQYVFMNEQTMSIMMDYSSKSKIYNGAETTQTKTEEEYINV